MSNVEICILLNIIILVAFGYEIWKDLDVIEDKQETVARRRLFTMRFIISSVVVCVALIIIYSSLGVGTTDLIGLV